METQGVIEDIQIKEFDGGSLVLVTIYGNRYSSFDVEEYSDVKIGDTVKLTYRKSKNGKYNNIQSIEPIIVKIEKSERKVMHLTEENIRIGALVASGDFEKKDVANRILIAQRMEKYIKTGE